MRSDSPSSSPIVVCSRTRTRAKAPFAASTHWTSTTSTKAATRPTSSRSTACSTTRPYPRSSSSASRPRSSTPTTPTPIRETAEPPTPTSRLARSISSPVGTFARAPSSSPSKAVLHLLRTSPTTVCSGLRRALRSRRGGCAEFSRGKVAALALRTRSACRHNPTSRTWPRSSGSSISTFSPAPTRFAGTTSSRRAMSTSKVTPRSSRSPTRSAGSSSSRRVHGTALGSLASRSPGVHRQRSSSCATMSRRSCSSCRCPTSLCAPLSLTWRRGAA